MHTVSQSKQAVLARLNPCPSHHSPDHFSFNSQIQGPWINIPGSCGEETGRGESKRFPETRALRGMCKRCGSIATLLRASRLPGSAITEE